MHGGKLANSASNRLRFMVRSSTMLRARSTPQTENVLFAASMPAATILESCDRLTLSMTSPLEFRLKNRISILALQCRAGIARSRVGEVPFIRYTEQIPLRIVSGFAPNLPIAEIHT
jgi:hypothetical protein